MMICMTYAVALKPPFTMAGLCSAIVTMHTVWKIEQST